MSARRCVVTDQMLRSMEIELNAYLTGLPLEKITLLVIMELSSEVAGIRPACYNNNQTYLQRLWARLTAAICM